MRPSPLCAAVLALALGAGVVRPVASARAQEATPAASDEERCTLEGLEDGSVRARIADVRASIARHEGDMRHWWSAFLVLHTVMMGASLTFAITAPDDGTPFRHGGRIELSVQVLSSFLGLVTLLTSTSPLIGAGGRLDSLPEGTPEERLAKLVEAESLLRRSADSVSFVRSPLSSLLSAGYSLAASITLLGFERPIGALLLAGGSAVIGQGRLLLHPWGIRDEWRRYQRVHADAGCVPPPSPEVLTARTAPRWSLDAFGAGVSFVLAF